MDRRNETIAFTLPISCHICLGKVKQPIVCPNQHAFCSPCMDAWLERNQQCPACRVNITPENPCRRILGGLHQDEEAKAGNYSSKELRNVRVKILFQEFEDEIERLEHENNELRTNELKSETRSEAGICNNCEKKENVDNRSDVDTLIVLTQKLQEATGLYEKVKQDMKKLKDTNSQLREENVRLTLENQNMKTMSATRSPIRPNRYGIAALETKVETYEKEINQLNKALEKSDAYIEEIESELETFRTTKIDNSSKGVKGERVNQITDSDGLHFDAGSYKKVDKSVDKSNNSFELEAPTPIDHSNRRSYKLSPDPFSPSEPLKNLYIAQKSPGNTAANTNFTSSDSFKKKLCFGDEKETKPSTVTASYNDVNKGVDLDDNEKYYGCSEMDSTRMIQDELADFDITVTPELSDCIKLMNRAEKKVKLSVSSDADDLDKVQSCVKPDSNILYPKAASKCNIMAPSISTNNTKAQPSTSANNVIAPSMSANEKIETPTQNSDTIRQSISSTDSSSLSSIHNRPSSGYSQRYSSYQRSSGQMQTQDSFCAYKYKSLGHTPHACTTDNATTNGGARHTTPSEHIQPRKSNFSLNSFDKNNTDIGHRGQQADDVHVQTFGETMEGRSKIDEMNGFAGETYTSDMDRRTQQILKNIQKHTTSYDWTRKRTGLTGLNSPTKLKKV